MTDHVGDTFRKGADGMHEASCRGDVTDYRNWVALQGRFSYHLGQNCACRGSSVSDAMLTPKAGMTVLHQTMKRARKLR